MPIKKSNKSAYPPDWKEISLAIRNRANWKCEGTPQFPDCQAVHGQPHPETGSRVVLTVSHTNHVPSDCRPENLRALCQRCHLSWDREHHALNARITRTRKKLSDSLLQGQLPLFCLDDPESPNRSLSLSHIVQNNN